MVGSWLQQNWAFTKCLCWYLGGWKRRGEEGAATEKWLGWRLIC